MKGNVLGFIVLFLGITNLHGQNRFGNTWLMGVYGYYVDFNSSPLVHDSVYIGGQTLTAFLYGKSNICDSNGNVILVSDGMNIYSRLGVFIEGGDTLASKDYYAFYNGNNPHSQSSIFLPMDNGKYYFVMPTCNDTNLNNVWLGSTGKAPYNQLLFSVIDMKANAGAGKVVARNIPLMENKEISKTQMMACRHSNGKDWWLLKMMGDSNNIATFLFTQDSVIDKGLQRMPFYGKTYLDLWGQMVFNQAGSRLATTSTSNMGDVFLADFDRCYGILSNYKKISAPILSWEEGQDTSTAGLAFSPNGRFLYVTKYSHVVQYDLQQDSWYVVSGRDTTYNNFTGFFSCALAPDNKIYIGNFSGMGNQMSTINNPDQLGAGCNFCPKCFRAITNSYKTAMSVPPCMPNYELGAQVCWPLEVNEVQRENVKVYPNPTFNEISVYVENFTKPIPAKLMNYVGQVVNEYSLKQQHSTISMDELPTGIYFLIIQGQVTKVVKE